MHGRIAVGCLGAGARRPRLDGDIADSGFDDLGYDSLALLELCNQVERRYGIQISDDAVLSMPTPAKAVAYINSLLTAKAGA